MIKNIRVVFFSLALLGACSCKGFLDEYPDSAIPEEQVMENLDDCSNIVTGIYSAFKSSYLYSGSMSLLPDIQADMAYASDANMGTYTEFYRWQFKPTNAEVQGVYASLYSIAATCNFFLENVDKVESKLTTEAEKAELEKRLGDVYFARALAFAELIRFYCEAYDEDIADKEDMGISLKLSYADDTPVKRSTLRESYAQVISDLDNAEKYIPSSRSVADSPYFSIGAVNALRARIYMYMGGTGNTPDEAEKENLRKSVEYASKVIDSGVYELCDGTTGSGSDYELIWSFDTGSEIIWKVGMSSTSLGGSLGTIFLNFVAPDYYNPDYVFAQDIRDLYSEGDCRASLFVTDYTVGTGHEQPMIIKYFGNTDLDGGATKKFINMPKVFRLSEVYLDRAEAYYKLGMEEEANSDLTSIRKKRITAYGQSGASGDDLFKEIQNERACELYMEGFRLSDLKRWKLPIKRSKQIYTVDGSDNNELNIPYNSDKYCMTTWPIPKHELEATNGVVKGNASNDR